MPNPIISYTYLKENCGERILNMIPGCLDENTWNEINPILEKYIGAKKPKLFVKAARIAARKLSKKHDDVKERVMTILTDAERNHHS